MQVLMRWNWGVATLSPAELGQALPETASQLDDQDRGRLGRALRRWQLNCIDLVGVWRLLLR